MSCVEFLVHFKLINLGKKRLKFPAKIGNWPGPGETPSPGTGFSRRRESPCRLLTYSMEYISLIIAGFII